MDASHGARNVLSALQRWRWVIAGVVVLVLLGLAAWWWFKGRSVMSKPQGRQGVKDTYGDFAYTEGAGGRINPDSAWKQANLTDVQLHTGHTVLFHQLVAGEFRQLFEAACNASGWTPKGPPQTYVPRHINWDPTMPLSYHSWGIAFDIDPSDNPRQGHGTVEAHPEFIQVFEDAGWTWGGRWGAKSRDPMHFEALRE